MKSGCGMALLSKVYTRKRFRERALSCSWLPSSASSCVRSDANPGRTIIVLVVPEAVIAGVITVHKYIIYIYIERDGEERTQEEREKACEQGHERKRQGWIKIKVKEDEGT